MVLPAGAHHSHGNYVDTFSDVEGVVKEIHPLNPHSWVYITVKGTDGQPQIWALEATSKPGLERIGVRDLQIVRSEDPRPSAAVDGTYERPSDQRQARLHDEAHDQVDPVE